MKIKVKANIYFIIITIIIMLFVSYIYIDFENKLAEERDIKNSLFINLIIDNYKNFDKIDDKKMDLLQKKYKMYRSNKYNIYIFDKKKNIIMDMEKNVIKNYRKSINDYKQLILNKKNDMISEENFQILFFQEKNINNPIMFFFSVILFLLLFLGFVKWRITQNILKPIFNIQNYMKKLAEGDIHNIYQIKMPVRKRDRNEIDEIAVYYNKFLNDLKEIIIKIRDGAEAIMESAREINSANQNIAEKASLQASSLEKTSNEMVQISKRIDSNTNETNMANIFTEKTKNNTERAGILSNGLKKSILSITESSKKIESIIDVINDIAFQTNLLALNAAVEAARAGEQGKGFAVVAFEVRNLSQKTTLAAKQIKEHIKESVRRVEEGHILVETTIGSLGQIVEEVKQVSEAINKIAISAKEQNESIANINRSIFELDEITQTNAGISQETSASTTILYNQATDFIKMMKFFDKNLTIRGLKEHKDN